MDVLLIPGFMLDADLWTAMRPGLDGLGQTVDVDTTRDDTIAAMADRAIAGFSAPAIVIGFSMGGYVAREIVYRAPNKVQGLILVASSSARHDPRAVPTGSATFLQLGRAAVARSLHPGHRSDILIERVQAMSERLGGEVFRRQSTMERVDDTVRLAEITCPTLIIAAAQDQLRSIEESQLLHEGIKSSELKIIEQSGHLVPIEQPSQLLATLCAFAEGLKKLPTFSYEGILSEPSEGHNVLVTAPTGYARSADHQGRKIYLSP